MRTDILERKDKLSQAYERADFICFRQIPQT